MRCIEQLFLVSCDTKRDPFFRQLTCLQSRSARTILTKKSSRAPGIFARTPKMSHMATNNQDSDLETPSPPTNAPLTASTLFPTLPLELQRKIWRYSIQQANIIPLRLEVRSWSFFDPPLHPVLHVSKEAPTEAMRYFVRLPSFPRSGGYHPQGLSLDRIALNMPMISSCCSWSGKIVVHRISGRKKHMRLQSNRSISVTGCRHRGYNLYFSLRKVCEWTRRSRNRIG